MVNFFKVLFFWLFLILCVVFFFSLIMGGGLQLALLFSNWNSMPNYEKIGISIGLISTFVLEMRLVIDYILWSIRSVRK